VLLAPYVAGPWTEGDYIVEVPLTAADVAAIPEGWRGGFESGGG